MSAATASTPSSSGAPVQNGAPAPGGTSNVSNGDGGASSSSSAVNGSSSQTPTQTGAGGSGGVLSIPPHFMPFLLSMNKEKLTNMITKMKSLQAAGQNEQNNQEYANLMNAFRYFQQMQAWRQQQQQARSSASPQHINGDANASGTLPAASAPTGDASLQTGAQTTPASTASGAANGISAPTTIGAESAKPAAPADATSMSTTATSTFTSEQLSSLKTQIIAFKLLARNKPIPDHIKSALLNPDKAIDEIKNQLDADAEAQGAAGKVAQAGIDSHRAAEAMKEGRSRSSQGKAPSLTEEIVRPSSPTEDATSNIYPYNAFRHPFTYLSKPSMGPGDFTESKAQRLLIPSLMPAGLDAHMLLQERDRFINARIQQRIRELESFPSTMSQRSTLKGTEQQGKNEAFDPFADALQGRRGDNAKLKALIELKSLQLLPMQRALRESVTKGMAQATTLALDRTAFRRFKKQTLRDARVTEQLERKQRVDREKRARQNHVDYLNTICNHGRELMAAHKAHQQNTVQKMGKLVMRLHADVEREEQKRIERIAKERLNALKADDEEAYLKLIDTAKDTRITHLIRQTDAYLDNLAQAVQAQQNDDVHADAIAAERAGLAQPSAEDLAAEKANQEVGVAVDETMFGAQRQDDPNEDKGKVDYYSVAHRITERITAQPNILVGGTLKEYQIKGLQWMVSLYNNRLNGILADEMGLGKTIQTISLITFLIETKKQRGPYLVIVPLSTLTNWINEFEKWAPSVTTVVYKGVPNVRKNLAHVIRMGNYDCLLTTYEYIIKDKHLLGKIKWTHMIIDEGHRMKNTQSKLTVTLTQHYISRYRLLLTGTPLQNNLPELWALLNFVLPKIFNSVKSFDEWFNTPFANTGAGDGSMQLNEEEALLIIKRLHKVLRPFLLRRLKKDVESELPDKVEKVIKCKMSSLQRKLYQQMKNHKMLLAGDDTAIGGTKSKGIRGLQNAIMQLRKICNHPYVFEQVELAINPTKENGPDLYRVSGKFELLDRILPKLKATKHRVLIFFQMTAIMDIMEDFLRFRGFKYLRLDGGTKPEDRSHLLTAFNAPGSDIDIFILSTRAGGLGLNLQTADTVIIYDSDWNPHQDLQAQDRAHRIGQKMEVRILRLVTSKSVEETILERARGKLEIDGKVIQAGKFDNQATAAEREDLLRAMLEADTEEEDDEEGDFNDDELNQLLARADDELDIFKKLDMDREEKDNADWTARGWKGKPPERLIQEEELPSLYQQDFETATVIEDVVEETPVARRRNVVHYDDGLTEEQFLRALEDDDVDIADVVEKKRERAEKRRMKQLQQANQSGDTSEQGTPEPTKRTKTGGRGKNSARATETPEAASPAPTGGGGRKRKRQSHVVESPSPDDDDSYGGNESRRGSGGGGMGGKRQKKGADDTRERIHDVLLQCYRAVENCYEEYTDGSAPRKRTDLFMDIPKKSEYPDYHVIIQRPICMRQIRRRIDNRTYKTVSACRDDFALMIANAKTYNQEGSWVYNDAIELMSAFDSMYNAVARSSGLPGSENEGGDGEDDEQDQDEEDEQPPAPPVAPVVQSGGRPKIKLSMKGRSRQKKEEDDDDE